MIKKQFLFINQWLPMDLFPSSHSLFFIYQLHCPSSSSSSSTMKLPAFEQADPWQCPQATEHFIPCLMQLHLAFWQLVRQLHRMILSKSSGAGGKSVIVGDSPASSLVHPHNSGERSQSRLFHWQVWRFHAPMVFDILCNKAPPSMTYFTPLGIVKSSISKCVQINSANDDFWASRRSPG